MRKQQSTLPQNFSPLPGSSMPGSAPPEYKGNCTLIESIYGDVKLIRRSDHFLQAIKFSSLKDCLEYVDKNRLQINVIHLGMRREEPKEPVQ